MHVTLPQNVKTHIGVAWHDTARSGPCEQRLTQEDEQMADDMAVAAKTIPAPRDQHLREMRDFLGQHERIEGYDYDRIKAVLDLIVANCVEMREAALDEGVDEAG
jgi:hypothetical protein